MQSLDDAALKAKTADFRQQLDQGAKVDDVLVPAFAVCREAAKRVLGMRHYDVQLIGGMVLHQGKIAEMKTGEGKTLVATLACYLNALSGKGVHVVTVNDYLARRDAEWMSKLYDFLGLSTGVIVPQQSEASKKNAYRCDITYGQNNEFGFDYLRDNMKFSIYDYVQRDLHYAIVDEVDSILVDEARTPLIISGPGESASAKYGKVSELVSRLRLDEHYTVDEKNHSAMLTEEGIELAQRSLHNEGLIDTANLYDPVNLESLHILQQSLRAHTLYKRDQHYMVSADGKVMIIDEFTGYALPGRRWSDGLHQAVEAKEQVPIQDENITLATISFQNFFRLYDKLSGMTGTADTEATEFNHIYKLDVVVIPTNKPVVRDDNDDLIYRSEREKFHAVVEEIERANTQGQPVLVGTTSVEKSDALSRILTQREVPHNVLNAKQHTQEAYVVAQAGKKGAVTVATNMAGRGTDILLGGNPEMLARLEVLQQGQLNEGSEAFDEAVNQATERHKESCARERQEVLDAGGLHIVGTERHESRRIDNQLRGRAGRQGDPGSSRFYLAIEDDLMRIFAGERMASMMDRLGMEENVPIEHTWVTKAVENAQRKVEERNCDIRKNMREYDDVLNQQRKSVYNLRRQVLTGRYETVPTDEELNKGVTPRSMIKEVREDLQKAAEPIVREMVIFHSLAAEIDGEPTPESIDKVRAKAKQSSIETLTKLSPHTLEQDLYMWFGCLLTLKPYAHKPQDAFVYIVEQVGRSLSEQHERLLDMLEEVIATMVGHACPPRKHFEDWDLEGLRAGYRKQLGLELSDLESYSDALDIAKKLYGDAEAVLESKAKELRPENFHRLCRNVYLQDIDKQWISHLQNMDQLRDGIGLRGYGQRDPKREYKREGFNLFTQMMQSIKASVVNKMFHVERAREEDIQALEEQRREQAEERQQQSRTSGNQEEAASRRRLASRAARRASGVRAAKLSPQETEALAAQTVRRSKPKLKRNDPCWCGSGKKYKNCHYRIDLAEAR